ncbi:MAG: NAD(P)/FAD-dependent oxidoreductase [Saprospiraceae bacterium]
MNTHHNHLDVIIIGAGLSGIGAAHHLTTKCPDHSFAILEARPKIGGTWDLFKYPGIRSDSDMYTLGYAFKPWLDKKALADGPSILSYIKETAKEGGYDDKIKYNHKVIKCDWSSTKSMWSVKVQQKENGETLNYSCGFLFACSGYYSYDSGYIPKFKNREAYKGIFIHPQEWPDKLDYHNKKVVIIGSGATAVTIMPVMAKIAAKVTMLQRSPTYILSVPEQDKIANFTNKYLPKNLSYLLTRWRKISMGLLFFKACRKWPKTMGRMLVKGMKKELADHVPDADFQLTPKYNPWDQRLCAVPDGDLFESIKNGKGEIVTDHIEEFTDHGIMLKSGKELEADIVVCATGLIMKFLGGVTMCIDGMPVDISKSLVFRGMMFSDIPNMAQAFGYTNASWTLKCDLTCDYVCRLLKYMRKNKLKQVIPKVKNSASIQREPLLDFNSGYVLRAIDNLPKQGSKKPWKLFQNYFLDLISYRYSSLKDDALEYK